MNIDLIRLKNNLDEYITIDEVISFPKEMLSGTDLLKLDNVNIHGHITKDAIEQIMVDLQVSGVMVLPCSLTLEPTDVPFSVEIHDSLENLLEEIDENTKKVENSIDILPIIWENILMEIPMKVTCQQADNIKLEGDGWKVITD